jgi:hypothetical protein
VTLLAEAFQNQIYQITENGLEPEYVFDFGKHRVPPEFWDVPIYEGFEKLNQQGFYSVLNVLENRLYRMLVLSFQNDEGVNYFFLLINKASGSIQSMSVPDESLFVRPIMITESNQFVFYKYSHEVTEPNFSAEMGGQKFKSKLQSLDKNTPVLFWVELAK